MQTIERLNHLNLAVAPRTLHQTLEDLGSKFDNKVHRVIITDPENRNKMADVNQP